jgi:rubrerythrin
VGINKEEAKMDYRFEDYPSGEGSYEQQDLKADLEMIREDLVDELQAINQYEQHIENLESEEAVATLEHILEQEKEHVAELLRLIIALDPVQAEKLNRPIL